MSHLEKRCGRYYFRRKVPTALREHYGRDELRYSLRTPDRAEAMRLAAVETVRTDNEFAALLNPAAKVFEVVQVEPKMLREYVLDPDTLDSLPTGQTILFDPANPGDHVEVTLAEKPVALLYEDAALHGTGEPLSKSYKRQVKDARNFKTSLLVARAVEAEHLSKAASIALSTPAPTPAPSGSSPRPEMAQRADVDGARSLAELAAAWVVERTPVPRSVAMMDRTIDSFYEHVGRFPVASITKAHIVKYKDGLLAGGTSTSTTNLRLSMLRTLLNFAEANLQIGHNPARGVKVGTRKNIKGARFPFDLAALRAIFSSPVYVSGSRPVSGRKEAAYWLPLLALFTGARLEEIGQLSPEDVYEEAYYDEGANTHTAWVIRISNQGDGQGIKNAGSARRVPVHAELVARGFLEYVAGCKGQRRIFDLAPDMYGVETGKWGSWFSGYLRDVCKVSDKRMTFHSFRHTFIDICRALHIVEEVHDALTGHASGRVSRRVYGGLSYPLGPLVAAMSRYKVVGLKLPASTHQTSVSP